MEIEKLDRPKTRRLTLSEIMLKDFKTKLALLIRGREKSEELVNLIDKSNRGTCLSVDLYINGRCGEFRLQNDSKCCKVQEFIEKAKARELEIVIGPKGGYQLGFRDLSFIEDFNAYYCNNR